MHVCQRKSSTQHVFFPLGFLIIWIFPQTKIIGILPVSFFAGVARSVCGRKVEGEKDRVLIAGMCSAVKYVYA
jgi:hypothetical protein